MGQPRRCVSVSGVRPKGAAVRVCVRFGKGRCESVCPFREAPAERAGESVCPFHRSVSVKVCVRFTEGPAERRPS